MAALADFTVKGMSFLGGGSLQIKEPVTASIAESRAGNSTSHFGEYAASEQALIAEGGNANKGTKLEIDPNKIDYLYGNVNSGLHNTDRSTQLAQAMRRLGLETNESGTKILTEHLNKVVNTKGNVVDTYTKGSQKFEIRESLLIGPSGKATKLETSFEIIPDGFRRFLITIPKEGKK